MTQLTPYWDLGKVPRVTPAAPFVQRLFTEASTSSYGLHTVHSLHQWAGDFSASDSC
jgi:hypothetical protein